MRWWHSLNCTVQIQGAEAAEMTARLKRSKSNRLKHPINGWSSRDLQTILKEPLGSTPDRVGWSVSIVLTPKGWIGRIDNYLKGISKDLEVEPSVAEAYEEIRELERARRPFHFGGNRSGVLEQGVLVTADEIEEWDDWDEYEEDEPDNPDPEFSQYRADPVDEDGVREVLEQLALFPSDPASTSLAEVLEDFGINWQKIRQKARQVK